MGVPKSALGAKHEASIRVYHGARSEAGLYAWGRLDALVHEHETVEATYRGAPSGAIAGSNVEAEVLTAVSETPDVRAFICGNPTFVDSLRTSLYLA